MSPGPGVCRAAFERQTFLSDSGRALKEFKGNLVCQSTGVASRWCVVDGPGAESRVLACREATQGDRKSLHSSLKPWTASGRGLVADSSGRGVWGGFAKASLLHRASQAATQPPLPQVQRCTSPMSMRADALSNGGAGCAAVRTDSWCQRRLTPSVTHPCRRPFQKQPCKGWPAPLLAAYPPSRNPDGPSGLHLVPRLQGRACEPRFSCPCHLMVASVPTAQCSRIRGAAVRV